MNNRILLATAAAALGLCGAMPVMAQTAGGTLLQSSTTVTSGTWSIVLTGCITAPQGGSAAACSGADEVIPVISGTTLSLVFESATGGALETVNTTGGPGQFSDLSFSTITVSNTGPKITQSSVNVAGSESAGLTANAANLSNNEGTIAVNGSNIVGAYTNLATSPTLQKLNFAPASSVQLLSTDIKTNGSNLASGGNLTMSSATINFNAPEPISSSIFLAGLAGLGFARRKTRRPA